MSPAAPALVACARKCGRLLAVLLGTSLTFAAAALAGFGILVVLFKLGVAGSVDILFYRGVVLCGVAFLITTALLAYIGQATGRASLRDAVAAGLLSLGLNLAFLVILPVTIDRSLSVFILGYMAAHDDEAFTTRQVEAAFRDVYVDQLQQIERRMDEQRRSGNVVRSNDGYTLSPQGRSFITWARQIGWLFDADPRLVDQRPSGSVGADATQRNGKDSRSLDAGPQR